MKNGLYNKNVYWGKEIKSAVANSMSHRYRLRCTTHAYDKMSHLDINKGTYKALLHGEVIEAEVKNNEVVKIITRIPNRYKKNQDICGAILLNDYYNQYSEGDAVVKTVWTNSHFDNHYTINTSNYVKE